MKFEPEERICGNCATRFTAIRSHQKFCSGHCRVDAWRKVHSDPQKISELEHRIEALEKIVIKST